MGKRTCCWTKQGRTGNSKMKIKIPYFTNLGEKGESIELEVGEKNLKSNPELISQAIHVENSRQMTKAGLAKTKGLVAGGGKKPWKQKGTGRARAGSNRSPLWRGGGITFGPTGENQVLVIPKKMKDKAFNILLVQKAKENNIVVIENFEIKDQKTKSANSILVKAGLQKKVLMAIDESDRANIMPWRNIADVEIKDRSDISLNDLNSLKTIIFTLKSFEIVKQRVK